MRSHSPTLFFQACEVANPARIMVGSESEPCLLNTPFAVVGRDPSCDVVVDDPTVSPRHCYLQAIGSKVLCIDLGSERGLVTNEGPALACWLDPQVAVRIGDQSLRCVGPRALEAWPDDQSLMVRPIPRILLEFEANLIKTRWRMKRAVALVGASRECTVRLNGPDISRFHCALILTGQGLWVVDLFGRVDCPGARGISVDGERVRFARLDPGQVLQLGRFRINMRRLSPSSAHPPRQLDSARSIAAETHGSGEIELLGHARPVAGSNPDLPTATPLLEQLKLDYATRLDRQSRKHRAEVERLRGEIETLREQLDELQGSPRPPDRRIFPTRLPRNPAVTERPSPGPRESSNRTLGSARQLLRAPSLRPASASVESHSGLESLTVSLASMTATRSEPPQESPWAGFDDPLLTTTRDARQLS